MRKSTIFAFVLGAACGAGSVWYFLKTKYEKIAQEEIDSVKERFTQPKTKAYEGPNDSDEAKVMREKPDISEFKAMKHDYSQVLKRTNYANAPVSEPETGEKEDEPQPLYDHLTGAKEGKAGEHPYVVPPEEFGEFEDYAKISLTYYADHILADENDEMVEDIEDTVGFESLTHFGEYEDDSVFVRNDRLKCDYEILKDLRRYADILEDKPYLRRN